MKFVYTLFCSLSLFVSSLAQTPLEFKYQALARDISGSVLADQIIGLQISILKGSVSGTEVYVETHNVTTNSFGLININIGGGSVVSGSINSIDWSSDIYFIKIEMDPSGGSSYADMGTSQMLSVPYALHAKTAGNVFSGNYADLSGAPVNVSEFTNDAGFLAVETQTLANVLSENNDAAGQKITNLADPENPQDAVTKEYLKELLNRVETIEKLNRLKIYNDTVNDFEGNEYRAVEIGNQTWMVDNLKATKYADGTDITGVYMLTV